MVKVVCRMIGSGKTTYALNNKKDNDVLLDWDLISEAIKTDNKVWIKNIQDIMLKFFYEKGYDIWYITTKIGSNELELLRQMKNVEYIWINTREKQCIENIIKRNRNNEIEYINNFKKINKDLYKEYYINSKYINYKVVDVFENGERW